MTDKIKERDVRLSLVSGSDFKPSDNTSVMHGGGGGGDMLDKLEKRVEKLENNVSDIKTDLATLTTRSENFATVSNQEKLFERSEGFASKIDLAKLLERSESFATKSDLHKEINSQTKWIAGTIIAVAAICMAAARFLFK